MTLQMALAVDLACLQVISLSQMDLNQLPVSALPEWFSADRFVCQHHGRGEMARRVLGWDVSLLWQLETELAKTSEVEVRLGAEAPNRTRVDLEHRNLERHGQGGKV
jgi:hypothetical protein